LVSLQQGAFWQQVDFWQHDLAFWQQLPSFCVQPLTDVLQHEAFWQQLFQTFNFGMRNFGPHLLSQQQPLLNGPVPQNVLPQHCDLQQWLCFSKQ
jgi:hypothetical protein